MLKPVNNAAPKIQVNTIGEPVDNAEDEKTKKKYILNQSVRSSSNYRGLNTMSISLFEDSLFRKESQVSPFR